MTSPSVHHSPRRIAGIDGLRALAVCAVFLFHLNPQSLPGGFVGVDIFFVISGYVVCRSLLEDRQIRILPFIGAFYVRRLLRIYPALIAMLLIIGLMSTLFIPWAYLSDGNPAVAKWAFFGLSNFKLVASSKDYFSAINAFNPYVHTWSLAVEEQFYVIFPLLVFFVLSCERCKKYVRVAKWLLPSLVVITMGYSAWETYHYQAHGRAYFLLPSRFWELAAGGWLSLMHHRQKALTSCDREAGKWVGSGLILLLGALVFTNEKYFPFPLAILPVAGTLLCITGLASRAEFGWGVAGLNHPMTTWVGRISYSLYLWHWPVIVLMRWTIGVESVPCMIVAIVMTFGLASLSYYCLEIPPRKLQAIGQRQMEITLGAGIALVLTSLFVFDKVSGTQMLNRLNQSVVTKNRNEWYPNAFSMAFSKPFFQGAKGKPWSERRLFCVGDSHAAAYSGMFQSLGFDGGAAVCVESEGGKLIGSFVYPEMDTAAATEREQRILMELQECSRPGDIVLLACLRTKRLENYGEHAPSDERARYINSESGRRQALAEGVTFVKKLLKLKLQVIVDAPLPVFHSPPYRGNDWFNRMNPAVAYGFEENLAMELNHRERAMKSIAELKNAVPEVFVWDPLPTFTDGNVCCSMDGKMPNFFDGDHLSQHGGKKLYPSFKEVIQRAWN